MTAIKPQLLHRGKGGFLLGWKPLPGSQVKYFNIYKSSNEVGPYVLFRSQIGNDASKDPSSRGHVAVAIKDSEIPFIGITNVYFKVTAVDRSDVESDINDSPPTKVDVPNVALQTEGENGDRNVHLYAWDEPTRFWTKLRTNSDGALLVDIGSAVNITVGAVKVAALADNTTLKYLLVDNNRKLVVTIPDAVDVDIAHTVSTYENTDSIVESIEAVSIAPGAETVILTFVAPVDFMLVNVCGTGSADGVYRLKIDGDLISKKRTNWTERNADFNFGKQGIKVIANETIELTVEQNELTNHLYDASIFGYVDIII